MGHINKALIVVPATLLDYWEYEIKRWVPVNDPKKRIIVFKIRGTPNKREAKYSELKNLKCLAIISVDTFKID